MQGRLLIRTTTIFLVLLVSVNGKIIRIMANSDQPDGETE